MIKILVLLVIIFSFAIRIWQLDTNPAGFFVDEAVGGYEAWHIINFGNDSHGENPLFFKGLNNDSLSPFNTYLPLPFVAVFGLNEFAIRLTAVTFSVIGLFVFYLTLKQLISTKLALLGMIMLSISPWHFHLSRIHINDYYAWILLVNLALLFLLKAIKSDKKIYYILSGLSLSLASYSYYPSRLISPLLFFVLLHIVLLRKKYKSAVLTSSVFALILMPFIWIHLTSSNSFQRLRETAPVDAGSSTLLNRSSAFLSKYFLHFSDEFLFQNGDADFPGQFIRRHSIPGLGLLYPYQKFLLLAGAIWLILKIIRDKKYELLFIIYLLLLFPIPDSLTDGKTPFATRSYLGVLPLHLLIAFGIHGIYQILSKTQIAKIHFVKILITIFLLNLVVFPALTLFKHFNEAPKITSDFWGWQYGPKEIMKYFLAVKDRYDELYMSGEFNAGHIFLSFYDPQNTCQSKCKMGDLFREPHIYNPSRRQLFSLSPDYLSKSKFVKDFSVKKTIYYPNGNIAFQIGEIVQ